MRVWNLLVKASIEMMSSMMAMRTIIVEPMKMKTCAEHRPQMRIKHMTEVMIDEANRQRDMYLSIQRSYG